MLFKSFVTDPVHVPLQSALHIHGSTYSDSANHKSKISLREKKTIVADVYYVVRPTTEHVQTSLSFFPKQYSVITIYTAFTLHQVL